MEDEKKLTAQEIDDKIKSIKGIWGIEGMGMTEEEERIHRSYLAGEITKEEYESHFLGNISKRTD